MNSVSKPELRSLSVNEIDEVSGGGFWAVAAVIAPPVITATVVGGAAMYLLARDSGRDKAKRDNDLGVCRVPNT